MYKRHILSIIVLLTLFSALTAYAGAPRSRPVADYASSRTQSEMLSPSSSPGIGTWPVEISLNRTKLNFGATAGGTSTGPQTFRVSNAGGGTLAWTISTTSDSQLAVTPMQGGDGTLGTWLDVRPSQGRSRTLVTTAVDPTGLSAGTYHGTISVNAHTAINSPQTVDVNLRVYGAGGDAPPLGGLSTPAEGSTVSGSVPVTGWALDDIGVGSVGVHYYGTGGPQYLGDATFVEGARPDIAQSYPDYPNNYKAGWDYTWHTNLIPDGSYTLCATATDSSGNHVTLGCKDVIIDNTHAVKPFGAIDTPTQGGMVSGTARFEGWALTPQPNSIPTDGSTINVSVDGVNLGHPTYNQYRADIASQLPGYANSNGAGGYFDLDTTGYHDGVHTIYWTATDSAGNTDGIGSRFFTINNDDGYEPPTTPEIKVNHTRLNFSAQTGGSSPSSQSIRISNSGSGNLEWTASPSASWLDICTTSGNSGATVGVSANPSGLSSGTYHGAVTVSAPNASNSPVTINVNLQVRETGDSTAPFGSFDTPVGGSTVRSSVPVTGWVLDDAGVENVKVYYQQGTGSLQYVADAVMVEGARPDIELNYPGYPNNHKAGWGYMMLTNFLPGDGTYTLHAIATDTTGNQTTLGTKTIIVDNASAIKPFGAIDTPLQGGMASGTNYVNWGWALTPQPGIIPKDGSTINVWVDGVNRGSLTSYDIYRADIATLFPGYANSDGAVGYFDMDTTGYANGVHTIYWTATDSEDRTDGIGSRYFNIENSSTGHVGGSDGATAADSTAAIFSTIQEAIDNVARGGTVYVAAGTYTESVTLDKNLYVVLSGDVTLDGDLSISAGSFIASAGNLSITGDLTHSAGAFDPNGGTVIFDGGGIQTIDGDTLFFNVTVGSGVELETTSNVALDGTLVNHGVTRETKAVVGTGAVTFGLADVTVDVTTAGMTDLQVERRDQNHPDAPAKIQTGRYWSFTPTGSGFTLNMTLPHNEIPESNDQVCRYTGTDQVWDCAADSFDGGNQTITRNGITQLSDWATWNDAPAPLVYLPLVCK